MEQEECKQFGTRSRYLVWNRNKVDSLGQEEGTVWNRKCVNSSGQKAGKQFGTGIRLAVWDRKKVRFGTGRR